VGENPLYTMTARYLELATEVVLEPTFMALIKDEQRLVTKKIIWKNDLIYGIVIMIKTNMVIFDYLPFNLAFFENIYERKRT